MLQLESCLETLNDHVNVAANWNKIVNNSWVVVKISHLKKGSQRLQYDASAVPFLGQVKSLIQKDWIVPTDYIWFLNEKRGKQETDVKNLVPLGKNDSKCWVKWDGS